ncbi:cyclin-dependent kinase 2-associated protein 1 isoform X1 [Ornithorhynchus anatinus]|uniref:cyclin-dependent kinase 2-associated protein 1 isoform X1 n=1 Tax=Ornithorhynchus anatinus TaxID=9258 RepID=UPI00045477BB|nr:cyclin-dependent kinase 2-associated protein 1 isoform X1 [Ornithorhynchus anatinus]
MSCTDWDNLALPGQAFLPQEETLARTKERVLLKKQRNQKECLERSLEQEKTGEAKKQSQEDEREEKRKDGEVTMRSRENVKERVKEQRRVREATRKQRREKKKTTKALHINVSALVKPWEEEDKEYRKEEVEGSGSSQVPQSKYAELLAIIEELGKEIRPTYAGSKSAMERLKRGIIHARGLVRECLAETERNARS